jgi:hypothetical protein
MPSHQKLIDAPIILDYSANSIRHLINIFYAGDLGTLDLDYDLLYEIISLCDRLGVDKIEETIFQSLLNNPRMHRPWDAFRLSAARTRLDVAKQALKQLHRESKLKKWPYSTVSISVEGIPSNWVQALSAARLQSEDGGLYSLRG